MAVAGNGVDGKRPTARMPKRGQRPTAAIAKSAKKSQCSRGDKFWLAKISEAQDLLGKENASTDAARSASVEATVYAFRLGKLLQELPKGYGKRTIGHFAVDSGIKEGTLRDRIYLYRGCAAEEHIRRWPHMGRDYYIALGSAINGFFPKNQDKNRHFVIDLYVHAFLLTHPLLKEKDGRKVSDDERLKEAKKVLDAFHERVARSPGLSWALTQSTLEWQESGGRYNFVSYAGTKDAAKIKSLGTMLAEIERLLNDLQAVAGGGFQVENGDQLVEHTRVGLLPKFTYKDGNPWPRAADIIQDNQRNDFIRNSADLTTPQTETVVKQRLIRGDCLKVLADETLFPARSIDVVVADPPYSKQYYKYIGWRYYNEVEHDSEETIVEQANLIGRVARMLVRKGIIKKQFIWFSFFPMDYAHVFVPPILEAFEKENAGNKHNVIHQILTWNKVTGTKLNNLRFMRRDADGILYVNVGMRKLTGTIGGQDCELHSTLLTCPVKDRGLEDNENRFFWKPIPLLQHLIRLATHEDHSPAAAAQVVLDPFAGSGSTAVAALRCGRDYRLIESHDQQFATAEANLRKELAGNGERDAPQERPDQPKTEREACPWRKRCFGLEDG